MDQAKIAFIMCVNNADEYAESKYYIDRLELPEGFEKDIVAVQDAPCMAAGYNVGMRSSDAQYKVYMHQDVCIINRHFVSDLLRIFRSDEAIGMLGCIGATALPKDAMASSCWNMGCVFHNCTPPLLEYSLPDSDALYTKVAAVDGLLIATRYDLPWREELMDGWHFYDVSQSMEFQRQGYRVVVPNQSSPWCYHNNKYSDLTKYNHYRKRFIKEYAVDAPLEDAGIPEEDGEFEVIKKQSRAMMEALIQDGKHAELQAVFQNPDYRGFLHLREYELIADIDKMESENNSGIRLWEDGILLEALLQKLLYLRQQVKRLEYQADNEAAVMERLKGYSVYAIGEVCNKYVYHGRDLFLRILDRLAG